MTDMVAAGVKAARCERLAELERELQVDYFQSLIGRRLRVLVEGQSEDGLGWLGTSCRYAPVHVEAGLAVSGSLVDVRADAVANDCVRGTEY
jgi:tRNA A37 methylthiotransferase MiaB